MKAIDLFIEWLDDFLNFERQPQKNIFWLDTIDYLCKRFDNPQDFAPSVHVAGSKGKGSVSRMIACILEEAGQKVGVYSSPHISDFRERIMMPSEFFDEDVYKDAIKELVPSIESIIPENLPAERPITWFELVTLYAFLVFRRAKVDWSVFEVGMGGRLDTTNIIRPKICCITPIELEHTEFLGDTLEKIASEKAGIIKNCTPVVIAPQQSDAVKIILREKAITRHAPFYFVDEIINHSFYSFDEEHKKMKIHLESDIFSRPIEAKMQLLGRMQAQNAAMAVVTVKKLLPNLAEDVIERGLAKAKLPGRFEIIEKVKGFKGMPAVILDGAHTVNSIKLTIDTFNKLYGPKPVNLLFGCAADKDVTDIANLFRCRFKHIYLTKPGDVKASDLNKATDAFKDAGLAFSVSPDFKGMLRKAFEDSANTGSLLLITGSFYLVAEAKAFLKKLKKE